MGKRRACPGFLFSAFATGFAVISAAIASVAAVTAPAFFKIFTAIFCTFYRSAIDCKGIRHKKGVHEKPLRLSHCTPLRDD